MKKYQSLLDLQRDIESNVQFCADPDKWEQEYAVARWDSRGGLWFSKCYMREEDTVRLAHWILKMTQEEIPNIGIEK